MTPSEHDNQATSVERGTTELYPFSSGYPRDAGTARGPLPDWQAADQPLPELPALEQLPDPDALPDPGYPAMPASPTPVASQPLPMRTPWPVPSAIADPEPVPATDGEPGAEPGAEARMAPAAEARTAPAAEARMGLSPRPVGGAEAPPAPAVPVAPAGSSAVPVAPPGPGVPVVHAASVVPAGPAVPVAPVPAGSSAAPAGPAGPPAPAVPPAPAERLASVPVTPAEPLPAMPASAAPSFTPSGASTPLAESRPPESRLAESQERLAEQRERLAVPPERPPEFASGRVELPPWPELRAEPPPTELPRTEPSAAPAFRPGAYRPGPPDRTDQPSGFRLPAYLEAEPRPAAQRPLDVQPTWASEPYRAPRPPESAPPLRGPSVPWSQVRVGGPYPAAAEAEPPRPPGGPAPRPAGAPADLLPPVASVAPVAPERPGAPAAPAADEPRQRHSADALTADLLLPGKRATPDGGWRRTVYRATGGLIRVGESAASVYRRDLISRVRAPVAGGHYRVAVLSLKGGVGKTTVTVGLGSTLASLRGDRVIAVDGNPDRGTLSDKVRLETAATIRDLLNERAMVTRYADVRAYTSQASSRLEILASDRDPGVSVAFSADDYRAVVGVLEHFYSICITDCGTGLLHSAMAGVLELADQVVLVSSPSVDGARSASATLDWLEAHDYGDLVRGGVVVLSAIRRKSKSTVDLDRLEQHFAARCRAVVRVPYDAHLEEGAEVELEMLNDETADAYLELAALVADGFAHPRRSSAGITPGFPLA
jgi:MinD-like ATPase involved in chromosome partitioning or flagellar assembly